MSTKQRYLKLPPELGDGDHATVQPLSAIDVVRDSLKVWAAEGLPGDSVSVQIVEMTVDEFEALPEI